MIYWACFAAACIAFRAAESRSVIERRALTALGLSVLILLAALRDPSVGRDVGTYVIPTFNSIETGLSFAALRASSGLEIGFLAVAYITVSLTHNIQALLLVIECLIVLPLYYAIFRFARTDEGTRLGFSVAMGMLVFCAMFYNLGLSMMRQGVACSFVLLGSVLQIDKKRLAAVVCIILAWSFHHSGLIGFAVLLLLFLCEDKHRIWAVGIVCVGIMFMIFPVQLFSFAMDALGQLGVISEKYAGWQDNAYYTGDSKSGINLSTLVYGLYALVITIFVHRAVNNRVSRFLLVMTILLICLIPLGAVYATFGRIANYFKEYAVLVLPLLPAAMHKGRGSDADAKDIRPFLLNALFLVSYWFVVYQLRDGIDTANYIFFWSEQ